MIRELADPAVGADIVLPAPSEHGTISVEEAIARRRSRRRYRPDPLSLAQISQLLWSAQGITHPRGLRAAPSAGACYPLEAYLVVEEGVFHYRPRGHSLSKLSKADVRAGLAAAALDQGFITEAPVTIILTAVYQRTAQRYGERGERYVHLDVGCAAENVHLQAEALGLGSVAVGAFYDAEVQRVLAPTEEEVPLYLIPVGYSR